ncbi:MAG: hypothetical protein V3T86_11965, partial [Planctomycetota bacterium]
MPDAYLLLREYGATRPGFLVLDADGRRVDSLGLLKKSSAEVAAWLKATAAKKPHEVWWARIDGAADASKLLTALRALDGVKDANVSKGSLVLRVAANSIQPDGLLKLAKSHGVKLRLVEPAPIGPVSDRAKTSPGLWYVDDSGGYVTRVLLDPKRVGARELETRAFSLFDVSKGGLGARVAGAPLKVDGVISVHVDIFSEEERVVARKG